MPHDATVCVCAVLCFYAKMCACIGGNVGFVAGISKYAASCRFCKYLVESRFPNQQDKRDLAIIVLLMWQEIE